MYTIHGQRAFDDCDVVAVLIMDTVVGLPSATWWLCAVAAVLWWWLWLCCCDDVAVVVAVLVLPWFWLLWLGFGCGCGGAVIAVDVLRLCCCCARRCGIIYRNTCLSHTGYEKSRIKACLNSSLPPSLPFLRPASCSTCSCSAKYSTSSTRGRSSTSGMPSRAYPRTLFSSPLS